MKTKRKETEFKCGFGRARQLFSRVAWLGAVILVCSSASAQNLFVSGKSLPAGEGLDGYGAIFKFAWDGGQSVFASGLYEPAILLWTAQATCFSWIT